MMPGLRLLLSQDIGVQRLRVKSDRVCALFIYIYIYIYIYI